MNRLEKGLKLVDQVEIIYSDKKCDNMIHAKVKEHNVYYNNNLWRCDCLDYTNRGLNKDEGSFLCKHIYAVIINQLESK